MSVVTGEWVAAVNRASQSKGSIHDEERARELGFAHAVVGAGMHIPMVTRSAVELFGRDWYERGFLKARFTAPIHAAEAMRVVLYEAQPATSDQHLLDMKVEKEDGAIVLSGYLGLLAPGSPPVAPWQREGEPATSPIGTYDPLPNDQIGDEFVPKTMVFEPDESLPALEIIGDVCTWYEKASPWGEPILPSQRFVRLPRLASDLHPDPEAALDIASSMNALFQVLHLGPVRCHVPHTVKARLVGKGFSGRTAFRTSEAAIENGGERVGIVRQTLRWVPQRALQQQA